MAREVGLTCLLLKLAGTVRREVAAAGTAHGAVSRSAGGGLEVLVGERLDFDIGRLLIILHDVAFFRDPADP